MTVKFLTANTLAAELGIPGMTITRAVRRHLILPDATAGRTMLFRPQRLRALGAAMKINLSKQ